MSYRGRLTTSAPQQCYPTVSSYALHTSTGPSSLVVGNGKAGKKLQEQALVNNIALLLEQSTRLSNNNNLPFFSFNQISFVVGLFLILLQQNKPLTSSLLLQLTLCLTLSHSCPCVPARSLLYFLDTNGSHCPENMLSEPAL